MWSCSVCNREFSRTNQRHTCTSIKPRDHLKGKSASIHRLYEQLIVGIQQRIPAKFDAISFAINIKAQRNFGMIFVLKDKIKVEFHLKRKILDSRFHKTVYFDNKHAHVLFIHTLQDIDELLLDWISESYEVIGK